MISPLSVTKYKLCTHTIAIKTLTVVVSENVTIKAIVTKTTHW